MSKRGRPPLPFGSKSVRIVFYASKDELEAMRAYAEYEAETIQKITRRAWMKIVQHAKASGKIEFHGAAKIN